MNFKEALVLVLKGATMGAANVIPGVSGGTVAFITGIYERLINAIKSFDHHAVGMLVKFQFKEFVKHVDLQFLVPLGAGVVVSILSLARLLEYLLGNHEVLVFAFFFGLILASVYFVGMLVKSWCPRSVISLLVGAVIAIAIGFVPPAEESTNMFYLFVCGIAAISSMIIPGISGSFVLLIMGNYLLVLSSISGAAKDPVASLKVLIPFGVGCAVGIVVLSHFLSWLFKRFHDAAIALMTGFVAGSLLIIWPWKEPAETVAKPSGEIKILSYDRFLPNFGDSHTMIAIALVIVGAGLVWGLEKSAAGKPEKGE
ncbi:DUF368 domain-containing protein [Verrucomicrobia bacterium]|nr:DUF368 domain-containing protein [Verrucomicrobiota bacterium]